MNTSRITAIRDLFDREYDIYRLHTVIGRHVLQQRESVNRYADIALGHHVFYDESDGYPDDYVRIESDSRRMCDIAAVVCFLSECYDGNTEETISQIKEGSRTRFSPQVVSYLEDKETMNKIEEILTGERERYYRELYDMITSEDKQK